VTPLHDRVLVRRLEEKRTAKGGMLIPDAAKEKPQGGEVIAAGTGRLHEKRGGFHSASSLGDRVLLRK
jgi:chaperonin GroES